MNKPCTQCGRSEPVVKFTSKRKTGREARCTQCRSKEYKKWYKSNKQKVYEDNKERRNRNRMFVLNYLRSCGGCVDCPEQDPVVLTFDHVRGNKEFCISHGAATNMSIERLKREIAKCEIRCANCHMRKTAKQFGWYSVTFST